MAEATTPPNPADEGGSRPVPDPTVLTTDAIRREIAGLEKLLNNKLDAAERLTQERFDSVDVLMERAEEQRREQKQDTKSAVDAALQAQKEATSKMEVSVSDQLTSLRSNFDTSILSVQTSLSDLKDRVTVVESIKLGQTEQRTEKRDSNSAVYAAIGIGVTVLLAALTVVGFLASRGVT